MDITSERNGQGTDITCERNVRGTDITSERNVWSPGVLVICPAPDSEESPALPGQPQPGPGVGEGRQTVPLLAHIIKHLDT